MKIIVDNQYHNWSLRKWARYNLNIPFSELNLFLRKKLIKVDGKKVQTNTILIQGSEIEIHENIYFDNSQKQFIKHEIISNNIIFENEEICVIDKPVGVETQGSEQSIASLTNAYIVHRLDKATSGLVILAKSKFAANELSQQFRENTIKKRYQAICIGNLKEQSGIWNNAIDGKEALTKYTIIKQKEEKLLMHIITLTGRKHQIRQHCAQNNIYVLGDEKYGSYPAKRMYLDCCYLEFIEPKNKQTIKIRNNTTFEL